jgi:allene oxide cyclase-like protein
MQKITITLSTVLILLFGLHTSRATPIYADSDKGQTPEVIHFLEQDQAANFLDLGASGLSLGDRLIFTDDLFDDAGHKIGLDGIDCVIVRLDPTNPAPEQQFVQCTISVSLAAGQLTFQGLAHGADNFFALTGGTGAYRTARGEALVKEQAPPQPADVTITLFR